MQATISDTQLKTLSDAGIVCELHKLLGSRHWAQRLKLFSPQAARNMLLGNVRSRFRGRGMEFEEVRRYQPGDDIRTIDWKVSARAQGTYTKLFCEERERPCHILVDQRSHLFFGSTIQFKSVLAAELATALAWAALAGGDRIGGQVIGQTEHRDTRARRNKQAVLKFVHDICELNACLASKQEVRDNTLSLALSLEECRRMTRPGTAVFIVSDFHDFDQASAKALSDLAKHTDVSLLQVTDPLEESLPLAANVAISDGLHSSKVSISKRVQVAYQAERQQQRELLEKSVSQSRALFARISTASQARDALRKIFTR